MVAQVCMVLDQILIKVGQLLTIYVKNHKIHVKKTRNVIVSKTKPNVKNHPEKKSTSKSNQDFWGIGQKLGYWGGGGIN